MKSPDGVALVAVVINTDTGINDTATINALTRLDNLTKNLPIITSKADRKSTNVQDQRQFLESLMRSTSLQHRCSTVFTEFH